MWHLNLHLWLLNFDNYLLNHTFLMILSRLDIINMSPILFFKYLINKHKIALRLISNCPKVFLRKFVDFPNLRGALQGATVLAT